VHERLGDVDLVGHGDRLGVESERAGELGALGGDALSVGVHRLVDLERGLDVERAGRHAELRRGHDRRDGEALLPHRRHDGASRTEQPRNDPHRVRRRRGAVVGQEDRPVGHRRRV